ncbi:MAG: redox-regulated ATPase YchF [Spirochaetales bacterium]|nr:redox-regulated ATPase YchF [Spirochaetales bacterium]
MGFNCGIVGLPNSGKSTIFNALTQAGAQIASYPFCTIEPNRGIVPVPDQRLIKLGEILGKDSPIPTKIEFVDVAGLVKGASGGEGLGNKFLGHIRNVDALIHVVRCFHDEDVAHVMGGLDSLRDIEVINTELILSDIEILERAEEKWEKQGKAGDKKAIAQAECIHTMIEYLNKGTFLKDMEMTDEMLEQTKKLGLITHKPVLYLANTDEKTEEKEPGFEKSIKAVEEYAGTSGSAFLSLAGKIEEEISELPKEEQKEYLQAMGFEYSGLWRLIESAYKLLSLITFYTITTDLQAWTVKKGTKAPAAAGKIHTDFEKGFIRAEVIHYNDLVAEGSEHHAREKGLLKSEGKEYEIKDGDVIHFLFNV